MDHDVASYDRPYSGGHHSFDDETTEIVPKVPARRKPPVAKIPLTAKLPRPHVSVAMPAPLPERVPAPPRVAVPPASPRMVAAATPAPVRRRWSARTLAMFGAGMGTASGMLVAVVVLLALAITAPTGGSATTLVLPTTPAGVSWLDMVAAVGTTLVTGKPAVPPPQAPTVLVATEPVAAAPVLATVEAPAAVSAPVVAPLAPNKAAPRKPSRSKPRPRPAAETVAAAPPVTEAAPVAEGTPAVAEIDPWAAPTVGALTEVDPWVDPVLPVEPEGVAAAGPEVDLLAGDDGLGEVEAYTPVKPTLVDLGGTPESPDTEALSELETIQTTVVRIAVEGATAPVEVDGRKVGTAPVAVDLEPGSHAVTLFAADGKATTFELEATADLDEWCFETKGRTFGQVRCE